MIAHLDEVRKHVIEPLEELKKNKGRTGKEQAMALYRTKNDSSSMIMNTYQGQIRHAIIHIANLFVVCYLLIVELIQNVVT